MSKKTNNTFLTVQEVSDILRLNILTVYKYIRNFNLEALEFGGHYRIPKSALIKFINKHKVGKNTPL